MNTTHLLTHTFKIVLVFAMLIVWNVLQVCVWCAGVVVECSGCVCLLPLLIFTIHINLMTPIHSQT